MNAKGLANLAKIIVILLVVSCTHEQPDQDPDIPSKIYQFLPEN